MSATTSSINSTNIISDSAKMATLAAKAAGIQVGANGEPIIKNGSEYQAFQNELKNISNTQSVGDSSTKKH